MRYFARSMRYWGEDERGDLFGRIAWASKRARALHWGPCGGADAVDGEERMTVKLYYCMWTGSGCGAIRGKRNHHA
eukprot:GDKH01020591.1.p2 GENE.GDKH01020591.1~~GDKH01020591.1.p2  ORF type:complete len:76 (-),score=2.12 GDKH01020591.1:30-257(-)